MLAINFGGRYVRRVSFMEPPANRCLLAGYDGADSIKRRYWTGEFLFTPGFNASGFHFFNHPGEKNQTIQLPGPGGAFLGFW